MIYKNAKLISPQLKLIMGLSFIPAYLFQQSVLIRSVQFVLLIFIYIFSGGKFKILPNIILFFGVVFAYILNPIGKVIIMAGSFPITMGALNSGLTRALLLIGLIYISRLSVSSKLNFKGKAGNLIGRVFYYFEAITEGRGNFPFSSFYKPGAVDRLIAYIDKLLISVEIEVQENEINKVDIKKDSSRIVISLVVTFILVNYILLFPVL